jgi:hypothetical protein
MSWSSGWPQIKSESQSSPPRMFSREELDCNGIQPPSSMSSWCKQSGCLPWPWTTGWAHHARLSSLDCRIPARPMPSCAHLFLEWRSDGHRETIFDRLFSLASLSAVAGFWCHGRLVVHDAKIATHRWEVMIESTCEGPREKRPKYKDLALQQPPKNLTLFLHRVVFRDPKCRQRLS